MNKISKTRMFIMKYTSIIRKTSEYWTLSTAILLSGCMGIYEGGFECPAGRGVGCKSISEVNSMVNQGELPQGTLQKIEVEPPTPRNYEIWYAPARSQGTGFRSQENSFINKANKPLPKKERRKGTQLSDV